MRRSSLSWEGESAREMERDTERDIARFARASVAAALRVTVFGSDWTTVVELDGTEVVGSDERVPSSPEDVEGMELTAGEGRATWSKLPPAASTSSGSKAPCSANSARD